ncbi:hypothetical protein INR49_027222 [Caranx melampygus]|nr:hypothetical protein INR49_027222 [Caranx melampygus]
MFGQSIKVTVTPQDQSPVKPDLFILSPLSEQTSRRRPDVCLAAGFRPPEGQMVLRVKNSSDPMSTSTAVLSRTQKTYFFTGFSNTTLDSCELQGTVKTREEENQKCEETKTEDPSPPEEKPVEVGCEDLHPEGARLNFYLLLLNSVRVVFTKTVAFSTMVTIRALLF